MCWVVGFSLAQGSTGIGYYCFGAILPSLIEDSPQTSATSVSMKLEWLSKISICKNGCHGMEFLQVIKGLLTPTVPLNGSLLLAHIFTRCYFVQRPCHLDEFGNEPVVVSHKPQKTSDLHNICGCGPVLDSLDFALISGYSLGRNNMPQIG